ncbi:hypothetical protein CYMTET_22039 [Cymbomonas tetramitiformis]|uniref:DUF6589 domain-containing protein n=1 Tax=Cymbomonas tetramitiformis TaxID=36881 RepID=A0AAE0L2B5_9CHLO|nr:hypothetical protein CYMTET_22039 [Cymbomonas tetramitiformis]
MKIGVQRGAWIAKESDDQECAEASMEPTVPLHKLTVKAVLDEAVGDRGSLMPSGKDKEIIDTRIREQVQGVMASVAVEGVMQVPKRATPRWALGYIKTLIYSLIMLVNVDMSSIEGNEQTFDTFQTEFSLDAESDSFHERYALMIADGVPYGQAMRAIHRRALAEGKRHWLVPELGHFHKKLHLLEAIGKLSWSLGYDSLAIYLGKKKVMRESQKGVFEVHQDFLAMVFDGMWEAAILEWHTDYVKRFQNPSETSVEDKIADFLLYMDEVCATKKFTAFWWGQFLSNYGLLYFALRQAIRDGDSLMIETVQRRSVYLYKFTGKVKSQLREWVMMSEAVLVLVMVTRRVLVREFHRL